MNNVSSGLTRAFNNTLREAEAYKAAGPCYVSKRALHLAAKSLFRKIATEVLNLDPKQFDIRSNMAGDGVGGDITLHTDKIYMTINPDINEMMYRGVKSRKDYTGEYNRWISLKDILKPSFLEEICKMQS